MDAAARIDRDPPGSTVLDRILGWAGDSDRSAAAPKILAFRRFLYMHLAVQAWYRVTAAGEVASWGGLFAMLLTVCLALGWFQRWARSAGEVVLAVVLGQIVYHFPLTANHLYLEFLVLLLLGLFDPANEADNDLLLKCIRWLTVIALFHSGLKKLIYGYYFDGSFFAHMISLEERFAAFFRFLIPAEELARLQGYRWPADIGTGPYRVDSLPLILLSNATWVLEMLLPAALLIRRTRRAAMIACIAFVVAIELAAREVFFGALTINLLLLFSGGNLNRRLLPAFVALYVLLAVLATGLVPRWSLT